MDSEDFAEFQKWLRLRGQHVQIVGTVNTAKLQDLLSQQEFQVLFMGPAKKTKTSIELMAADSRAVPAWVAQEAAELLGKRELLTTSTSMEAIQWADEVARFLERIAKAFPQ